MYSYLQLLLLEEAEVVHKSGSGLIGNPVKIAVYDDEDVSLEAQLEALHM